MLFPAYIRWCANLASIDCQGANFAGRDMWSGENDTFWSISYSIGVMCFLQLILNLLDVMFITTFGSIWFYKTEETEVSWWI